MLEVANSKDLLASEITSKNLGLLHVLTQSFQSCEPPLEAFLQLSQRIMPRYYTIASSSVVHPKKIRIAISLT
jgi:sulfite reductase alpha subunit-like flavoprotein